MPLRPSVPNSKFTFGALIHHLTLKFRFSTKFCFQDLYCVRSDLGNLLKALGRLDEAKVGSMIDVF